MKKDEAVKMLRRIGYNAFLEDGVVMILLPNKRHIGAIGFIRKRLKEAGYTGSYGVRKEKKTNDSESV